MSSCHVGLILMLQTRLLAFLPIIYIGLLFVLPKSKISRRVHLLNCDWCHRECFELKNSVGWTVNILTHFRNRSKNVVIIFQFYTPIRTLILQLKKEIIFKYCTGFVRYEHLMISRMEEIDNLLLKISC